MFISAAVDAIQRSASERMTTGGSIKLNSTGDVVQKQGSVLDISGGSVNYTLARSRDDASNIGGGGTVVEGQQKSNRSRHERRRDPAQHRPLRFGPDPFGVVAGGHEQHRRGVDSGLLVRAGGVVGHPSSVPGVFRRPGGWGRGSG